MAPAHRDLEAAPSTTRSDVEPTGPNPDRTTAGNSAKRRKVAGPSYAPRKRSAAACNFCRLRKTKCDNVRPICGFCKYHQARCVYTDSGEEQELVPVPEPDETTRQYRTLLGRLDEIRDIVKGSDGGFGLQARSEPQARSEFLPLVLEHSRSSARTSTPTSYPSTTKCEAILKWPVFKGVIPDGDAQIDSFVLEDSYGHSSYDHPGESSTSPASTSTPRSVDRSTLTKQGIQEEAFVPLCRKFLACVHPRNPILEADELMAFAKAAAESGLRWDGPSCLVLLACALACHTHPWTPPVSPTGFEPPPGTGEDACAADAYYLAAKKRIGLLEASLLDIQCLFFACVYEKYSFRPLQAWFYLQQAGTRLRVHYLRRHGGRSGRGGRVPTSRHVEQRLFWSLFKAESELLPELGITPTCLGELDYPDPFPTPPVSLLSFSHEHDDRSDEAPAAVDDQQRAEEERSWFFYLAEISLRRIINDILSTFYDKGEEHWMKHIDLVCRQNLESEKQISSWLSHLPSAIQFDPFEQADTELVYYLQGRLEEWREYIRRPLLYYYIHLPASSPPPTDRIVSLAQQEVTICAACIRRCAQHPRHGGTWLLVRRSFRCAALIMAAVLRGGEVRPPGDWKELVGVSLRTLSRWEGEALDLRRMRGVLERLFWEVSERVGEVGVQSAAAM